MDDLAGRLARLSPPQRSLLAQRLRQQRVAGPVEACAEERLVAYVVPEHGEPHADDLRAFLGERLPRNMIPTAFAFLPDLPRTSSGKVDYRALPEVEPVEPVEASAVPGTDIERIIARIWQDALGIVQVGVHQNFFDIGGHSLLLVRVNSKLREVLQRDIPVIDLFRYPTIAMLARYLTTKDDQQPSVELLRERARKQKETLSRRRGRAQRREHADDEHR